MVESRNLFTAGIIDFNPNRMRVDEAEGQNIPGEFCDHVADWRQYPLRIGRQLEGVTSWYSPDTLWYYRSLFSNEGMIERLMSNDVMILSGSAMSAYYFQEEPQRYQPEDLSAVGRAQECVRDFLGAGKWVLGICFGGQLAIHAVGGRLGRLPVNAFGKTETEAGWLPHQLTPAGEGDEVFGYLRAHTPAWGPHLHNDYVEQLPRIGGLVQAGTGTVKVVDSQVLLFREGYLGRNGLVGVDKQYIHGAKVVFDNGARLYQIQPHPEMATITDANLLIRRNQSWMERDEEMGESYTRQALELPRDADYAIGSLIARFALAARAYETGRKQRTYSNSAIAQSVLGYLIG